MFCQRCGKELKENAVFCDNCGKLVEETPQRQPAYQPAAPEAPAAPQLPMKWFKFLIYFSLFASAVLNVINGLSMIGGSQYGGDAATVYTAFPGLQGFEVVCGIILFGLSAFAIYTRFRLAAFRQNGPKLVQMLYAAVCLYNIIYIVGYHTVLPAYVVADIDFTSVYSGIITNAVVLWANNVYFKKRAHLFVN